MENSLSTPHLDRLLIQWDNAVYRMNYWICTGGRYRATSILGRVHAAFFKHRNLPNIGNAWSFLGISVPDRMTIPKIDAWASAPISHTPCFELAISRQKRGGIKEVMVSCIFQTSSV